MFETHKLNDTGFEAVRKFKSAMAQAVTEAIAAIPQGRERSLFQTKIEEAMFFGTKAISSTPGNHDAVIEYPSAQGTTDGSPAS